MYHFMNLSELIEASLVMMVFFLCSMYNQQSGRYFLEGGAYLKRVKQEMPFSPPKGFLNVFYDHFPYTSHKESAEIN